MGDSGPGFLADRPRIRWDANCLYADSTGKGLAMTLFAESRKLVVNRTAKTIDLDFAALFFLKQKHHVRFDEISELSYRSARALGMCDTYTIVAEFEDRSRDDLVLARFFGESEFTGGELMPAMPQWKDCLAGFSAGGKKDSAAFFDVLKRIVFQKAAGTEGFSSAKPDQDVALAVWSDVPNTAKGYDASVEKQDGGGR